MNVTFLILTIAFILISSGMILVILVQRPQGGGLAAAFGGAGGTGADTVFGGRVGDALTTTTIGCFALYLVLAVVLNRVEPGGTVPAALPGGAPISAGAGDDTTDTSGDDATGDTGGDTFIPSGDVPFERVDPPESLNNDG